MHSYISQAHSLWQGMFYQVTGCLREQDLPTVTSAHEAGSPVHIQSHIAFGRQVRLAGMHAHAYAHRHTVWPGVGEERALAVHRRCNGITGARKGHEDGI